MLPRSLMRAGGSSLVGFSHPSNSRSSNNNSIRARRGSSKSQQHSPSVASSASMIPESVPEAIGEAESAQADFAGALPKAEIQATQFLESHPAYDGTGVIIAIFDTGVDPGAASLQTTPDGRPKIIDVVDCTGSGDVNTSKVVKTEEDGCITGVLGRKLKLNPEWKNPSGEWHVGAKPLFELFPGGLKSRIKEERKKRFDEQQRVAVTEATADLAAFEAANGKSPTAPALVKQKEDLEAKVKLLDELAGKYEDKGPVIEVVVWQDDSGKWVAALDTSDIYAPGSEKGLLADFGEPLTNFRDCRQYNTFSAEDALNYALNIYDEGNTLSIVTDAGSHGTHVAGIAAAYNPEHPDLNGVAPGAQIVSCKIGDHYLGSMETMVGCRRALTTVLENNCDLINMSYGEATSTPNKGRFIRLAEELVYKHNVIYVASAGNAGPALSTVGAPGGTSSAILGIGAFVTPALAAAGHSVREALAAGQQYTWSSRGPAPDGANGVVLSAPGGAISPVPQWSAQKMMLANGTSMSSPNACGGLALILSAMKAEGQPITPARVRRAVENTALVLCPEDPAATLTYGRGLLQVADAHRYLQQGAGSLLDEKLKDLRLEVSVRRTDSASPARGVYLRDPADAAHPTTWSVEIKPALKEDADVRSEKLEIDLKLKVTSTAAWVKSPELLLLHHNGRSFEIEIDPTALPEGLHYAEVQGFDSSAEWRGPLFRVPITCIKPLVLASQPGAVFAPEKSSSTSLLEHHGAVVALGYESFSPGKEMRRFVGVPHGATWAELKIKAVEAETPKSYMVRATAIRPHTRYSDSEYRSFIQLTPQNDSTAAFAVMQGTTLEITIAQFWSSLGASTLDMELTFHGVEVSGTNGTATNNGLVLDGSGGPVKVIARAPLMREKIKPVAKLDTLRIPLRPTDSTLVPMKAPRDVLPGGRTIHSLVLSYKLNLTEGGNVTPRVPLLNRYVYDSEVEAQMYFIRDENRQLLGVGDIYPSDVTLKKGDYTIELNIRHEDPALLEKMRALPMLVERKLESAVQVPVYATNGDAVLAKDALSKERPLVGGEAVAMFVGTVPEDKLPKDATSGRSLAGTFCLGVRSTGKEAPGALVLTYLVPAKKAEASAAPNGSSTSTPPDPEVALSEAVRDAEVKFLGGMKTDTEENQAAYDKILQDLSAKYPDHLPLLREPLKRLSSVTGDKRDAKTLDGIIAAADKVLAAVDTTELAVYLAAKCPEEGEGAAEKKKEMDEKKAAVVEALAAKCTAMLDKEALSPGEDKTKESEADAFEACYAELKRWVDPAADATHAMLASRRETRAGRLALALRALDKAANPDDKPAPKAALEQREKLMKELGWQHWAVMERNRITHAFPTW